MQTFAPWQAIYLSFYSKEFYRQVVNNWKGVAFLYLALMCVVSVTISAIGFYVSLIGLQHGVIGDLVKKLPEITIKDGTMKIDKPSPYMVDITPPNASTSLPVVMFDATTDEPKISPDPPSPPFVLTKHNMYIGSGAQATQYEWKQFEGTHWTQDTYHKCVDMITTFLPLAVLVIGSPFTFIWCAIGASILGAIGMAIAGIANVKLTYGELVRLAVAGMTPGLILEPLLKLVSPYLALLGFFLTIGFLVFGVLANKNNTAATMSVSPPLV
jgi:hypothetical protein